MQKQLIRSNALAKKLGVSISTLYRLRKHDCSFPSAIQLGPRSVAFLESEVDEWLNNRKNSM